jgi:predicted DNA-binding protein
MVPAMDLPAIGTLGASKNLWFPGSRQLWYLTPRPRKKVVYDAVLALKGITAKGDGNEGYIEHGLASETLGRLEKLTANTPEFKATAKVLKELVDHHIKEEESNIWGRVKENFSDEQRAQMNRDFLSAKKKVKVS